MITAFLLTQTPSASEASSHPSVLSYFSCIWLCATLWTVGSQAPLSMEFSMQEYWSKLPFLLQRIFPTQGLNPGLLYLLHWQVGSLPLAPPLKSKENGELFFNEPYKKYIGVVKQSSFRLLGHLRWWEIWSLTVRTLQGLHRASFPVPPSVPTGSSVPTDYLGLFLPRSDVWCTGVISECGLKTGLDAVFPYHPLEAQLVKHLPAVWETWVQFLGWEVPLEKEVETHSSILVWRIPWTEEPGRLRFMASQESDTTEHYLSFFPFQDHKTLNFWGPLRAQGSSWQAEVEDVGREGATIPCASWPSEFEEKCILSFLLPVFHHPFS